MAEVIFEDCAVPVDNRLGREGRGVEVFECSMEWERGCILAGCLGAMRRQLEECIAHARSRKQFGKPISKFQAVASKHRRYEGQAGHMPAARLSDRLAEGSESRRDARGGNGQAVRVGMSGEVESRRRADLRRLRYMVEQQIERDLRDAVGSTLYSGTSEIQRNIIASQLGL